MTEKTAAIVIDKWKTEHFERILKRDGFEFDNEGEMIEGMITLKIKTHRIADLADTVKDCQQAAYRSRMN